MEVKYCCTVGKNRKIVVTRTNFNFDLIYLRERREFYIDSFLVAILLDSITIIHVNFSKIVSYKNSAPHSRWYHRAAATDDMA